MQADHYSPNSMNARAVTSRKPPSWLRQAHLVLKKDLLIETRSGELSVTSSFFAVLVVVMGSLAFYLGPEIRGQVTAGVVWLAVAFSTVLSLSKGWQREREESAFEGLVVSPLSPSALFAGKAIGLLLFLWLIEAIVVPLCAVFFAVDMWKYGMGMALIALVATPGIAASATLFGAMTVRTSARDLILAIVLFPLLSPTLLAAVVATRELLIGVPASELGDYLALLAIFDVVFTVGGLGLFGSMLES